MATDINPLPQNLDAEKAVLGAILLDNAALAKIKDLTPEHFSIARHQHIFAAMRRLAERQDPIDLITVLDEYKGERPNNLESYLVDVANSVVTATAIVAHARLVKEAAARRSLILTYSQVIEIASDPNKALADAHHLIEHAATVSSPNPSTVVMFSPIAAHEFLAQEDEAFEASMEAVLDEYLYPGSLILFGGKPKTGKSTLVYELVVKVAQGLPFIGRRTRQGAVLILALEEHPRDIRFRLNQLGGASLENLYICPGPLPYSADTFRRLHTFIMEHQIRLLIIDSLSTFWTVTDENDAAQVTHALKPLLALARETGACVLLIHHNRKSEGQFGDDIRGSGAISGMVDLVVTIHRHEVPTQRVLRAVGRSNDTPAELIIELTDEGYRAIGDPSTATRQAKRARVLAALTRTPQLPKDISLAAKVGGQATRKFLNDLMASHEAVRTGAGTKSDPFRYAVPEIPDSPYPPMSKGVNEIESMTEGEAAPIANPDEIPIRSGAHSYRGKGNEQASGDNNSLSFTPTSPQMNENSRLDPEEVIDDDR
jgi:replicative DNA helicase